MKSNDLVTDEVSTGLDTLGNSIGNVATSGHDSGGTPGVGCTITAVLLDLEPNGTVQTQTVSPKLTLLMLLVLEDLLRARHESSAVIVVALGHVGDGRTNVGRRPQSPVQVDIGTGGHIGGEVGWAGTIDAIGGVTTTLNVAVGDDGHRAVALDGTGDSLGRRARVRVGVRLVELVRGTTDGTVGHVTVTGDKGRGSNEAGEVLHFVWSFLYLVLWWKCRVEILHSW